MNLILGTCNQYALPVWSPNFDKNTPKLKFTRAECIQITCVIIQHWLIVYTSLLRW